MMTILILFLIGYSLCVFLFSNIVFLISCTIFNIILCVILRVSFKKILKNILSCSFFFILVFLFNLIFDNVISSLIVVWKILIVTNFCFVFSCGISPSKMAKGLTGLFFPLKLFKVNTENIGIMFVIAFNFIPILREKTKALKRTLKARHVKLNLKNCIKMFTFMFSTFFVEIFKASNDIEKTLEVRGYKE